MKQIGTKPPTPFVPLSEIQVRAIELTLQGMSETDIVKTLKIGRTTLWRWKSQDLDFRYALSKARAQIHVDVIDRYHNLLVSATDVLVEGLTDPSQNIRIQAARTVMGMAYAFRPPNPEEDGPSHASLRAKSGVSDSRTHLRHSFA